VDYPRNDPIGVLAAETMYTGGREDMVTGRQLREVIGDLIDPYSKKKVRETQKIEYFSTVCRG